MGFDLAGRVWVYSSLVSGVNMLTCVFTSAVQDRAVQRCKRTGWTQQTGTGCLGMQQFVLTGWMQHVFSGKEREQHAAENREAQRLTAIQKC